MTTYTKKVTIEYASKEARDGTDENPFTFARFQKGEEMTAAGKTDGKVQIGAVSSSRRFVDQASAEEYLNFILDAAAEENVTIVSSQITDI